MKLLAFSSIDLAVKNGIFRLKPWCFDKFRETQVYSCIKQVV
ncbi:MAG: hypothetical protein ACJAYJ_002713 [Saprospiraceae bacterium]|jgi:hypothetical protein